MVMTGFRRNVAADTKRKSGKGKGAWYDKYRLPASPAPATPILLIKSEYIDPAPSPEQVEIDPTTNRPKPVVTPYFKVRKHKHKVFQGSREMYFDEVCSAGHDPHNPQPCVGCYHMDAGDKSVALSDAFCIPIVHLAYYHGHPLIDRNKGGIVMKNDNSGPVIIYSECTGRTCNFCKVMQGQPPLPPQQGEDPWPGFDPRNLSTVFARRRYLEFGKGHLSDLSGIDQIISSQCGNCRSQFTTTGFVCPYCGTTIIDMANDPRSDEQIAQDVLRPYPCMHCQRPVLLKEVVVCENCETHNAKGVQLSAFDVVIYAMRQGEGTKSHVVMGRPHQTVEEFGQTIDPRFLNNKSLREYLSDMAKPYDFDEMMKPRPPAEQAERLRLTLPPGMGGQQQPGYMPYGQMQPTQPMVPMNPGMQYPTLPPQTAAPLLPQPQQQAVQPGPPQYFSVPQPNFQK